LRNGKKKTSIVGDPLGFRGLSYAPTNEAGVIHLFGMVSGELGFYVQEVKSEFPDCTARRFNGRGWEEITIEFEFNSRNFLAHQHDPAECDVVVCWVNDWLDYPVEVVELRGVIRRLPNMPIPRPIQGEGESP
jgi:hypothetical protein